MAFHEIDTYTSLKKALPDDRGLILAFYDLGWRR